jgi:hypothetical protein
MEYLYLIQCNEFVKIGISYDVEERLSALQTGNPYPLAILDSFEFADAGYIEGILHRKFADARVQGEWFRLTNARLKELTEICQSHNGVRPLKPEKLPTVPRWQFPDISNLPTERVIGEEVLRISPTLRVERRGDRYPVAYAFYKRGKPVYVGYISEAMVLQ